MKIESAPPVSYCPVTGLSIRQHIDWIDVQFSTRFSCSYKILGKKTLIIQGNGYADLEAETAAISFGEKIVENYFKSETGYLMIQHWINYENASGKARNYFIKSVVNDSKLKTIIFCGGTHIQLMSALLVQKLGILQKEILINRTYEEAVVWAAHFELNDQRPKVSATSNLLKKNRLSKRNLFNTLIQDLLDYLGSIDWVSGKMKADGFTIKPDHPLLPVFDALTAIKAQLKKTTEERNQYLDQLLKHQESLENEIEIRTRKIRKNERYYSQILENSPISVALLDKAFHITYINKKALECFGYTLEELQGDEGFSSAMKRIEKSEQIILQDRLESIVPPPGGTGIFGPIEIEMIAADSSQHITETTFTSIENGYLVSIVDITKRKKAEEELYSLSITDPLTGFYNRRHFQNCLKNEFSRSRRYNHRMTLIIFDIDFFKKINDRYGHPAGDSILCQLAEITRGCFRDTDMLFRIGGEEFAIILPNTDKDFAYKAAERYRKTVYESNPEYEDNQISLTISLGISTTSGKIKSAEELFKDTDAVLYRAKKNGRNRIEAAD